MENKSYCTRYIVVDGLCVVHGDIAHSSIAGPTTLEVAIARSKDANTVLLRQGDRRVPYYINIPYHELTLDSVLECFEYYKQALKKAKEMGFKEVAVEAIGLNNEDDYVVALEFVNMIREVIGTTVGVKPMKVYIFCPDFHLCNAYSRVVHNRQIGSTFSVSNELRESQVILIPTGKKITKFEEHYDVVRKYEPFGTFLKCYHQPKLKLGEYYLLPGKKEVNCYYFAPLLMDKKDNLEEFKESSLRVIGKIIDSMVSMGFSSITIPILGFIPRKKTVLPVLRKDINDNLEFVKQLIDFVVDKAEEYNLQVEFYCVSQPLLELTEEIINNAVLQSQGITIQTME